VLASTTSGSFLSGGKLSHRTVLKTTTRMDSTQELQKAIDVAAKELEDWNAVIPFSLVMPFSVEPELCDNIMDLLKPAWKDCKFYFPQSKYAVDVLLDKSPGWDLLKKDLCTAAFQNGTCIVSNGGGKKERRFHCNASFLYKDRLDKEQKSSVVYRKSSLHGDRKNTRGMVGKSMPRRTATCLPVNPAYKCNMHFAVMWDDKGYYLPGGRRGNFVHSNHIRLQRQQMPFPKRLLDLENQTILESIAEAEANNGVGRNVHYQKTGAILSRQQVAYIKKLKQSFSSTQDGEESSPDAMFRYFKDTRTSYCCLYHHVPIEPAVVTPITHSTPPSTSQLVHEIRYPGDDISNDDVLHTNALELPSTENEDLLKFAKEHRDEMNLTDQQELMIACAWVLPKEKRLFQMYPEVIHVDATSDTNNENRPLLTITARDSRGNVVTVLRIFMPNERSWAFRWLFQVVLPTLLGSEPLQKVKVIITDGDSQETSQLDLAIALFFPQVLRVRCGWHIIDRGWKRNGPKKTSVPKPMRKPFDVKTHEIRNWMYSWMKPKCETEEEYIISKALFIAYLQSDEALRVLNESNCRTILDFFRENVEPHEAHFCFYRRIHIRHYDTYTNSAHEGSNHGLKSGAAPVLPQYSLDRSAMVLSKNADIRTAVLDLAGSQDSTKHKLWSSLPSSAYLNKLGESLLTNEWALRHEYKSERVSEYCWHVVSKFTSNENYVCAPGSIPNFQRVRQVQLLLGRLLCSCKHHERIGMPCRHILHVLVRADPSYPGVSHHDVSIVWHNTYYQYAYRGVDEYKNLSRLLDLARQNEVLGPAFPLSKLAVMPIVTEVHEDLKLKTGKDRCLNYTSDSIQSALRLSGLHTGHPGAPTAGIPATCTQESLVYNENDDASGCFTDGNNIDFPAWDYEDDSPRTESVFRSLSDETATVGPFIKEISALYEGNSTKAEVDECKRFLAAQMKECMAFLSCKIVKKKSELIKPDAGRPKGKRVSSSVVSNKKHRTHGTAHMKFC
jgi:hypothetical protein